MTFFTRGLVRPLVLRYTKTATAMYLNELKKNFNVIFKIFWLSMSLKKILNLKYILKITRENKEKQLFSFNAILLKFILSSSFFF